MRDREIREELRRARGDASNPWLRIRAHMLARRSRCDVGALPANVWRETFASIEQGNRELDDLLACLQPLGELASGVVAPLLEYLEKHAAELPKEVLWRAVRLASDSSEASAHSIEACLTSASSSLRYAITQQLSGDGEPDELRRRARRVSSLLVDGDAKVRYKAAEFLRSLGPSASEVAVELAYACEDPCRHVRVMSLLALKRIGSSVDCLPFLRRRLEDSEELVRYWAVRLLGLLLESLGEEDRALVWGDLYQMTLDSSAKVAAEALNATKTSTG